LKKICFFLVRGSWANSVWDINIGVSGNYNTMTLTNGSYTYCNRNVLVGKNTGTAYNKLMIMDGAEMDIMGYLSCGSSTASSTNMIVVSGEGSELNVQYNNNDAIIVGNMGVGNKLMIENGGKVNVTLGRFKIGVGENSCNNSLVMSSGGVLDVKNGFSVGMNAASYSNVVSVTGNSYLILTNNASMVVGEIAGSSFNRLEITDGSKVFSRYHFSIGQNTSANSNSVFLSGSGSVVSNATWDINVGFSGSCNSMTVADGALAYTYRYAYVGVNSSASNNILKVNNGKFVTPGTLYVKNLGTLEISGSDSECTTGKLDVRSDSILKFVIPSGGFNPVSVAGTVTFDNTTKLVVDATNFKEGGTVTLMNYGSMSGSISEANITLQPEGTIIDMVTDNSFTINVPNTRGTLFILR